MDIHRPSRTGRIPATAFLIALIGAGCAGSGGGGGAADAPREAASRFLDEVRAGRLQPAWEGASTEFKSLMGVENLRDLVRAHPPLKSPAEFVESRAIDRDGVRQAECVFHARAKVRGKEVAATITVLVAPDSDGWKVERLGVQ
ncbi:hypothetical protein [Planctomyces sp. SH-PL62]|uniref:hypothetical protein n=1 Tax=Planctomyces sp. SH-PL62 TaxID=1636152 RepID=UPI00078D34A7|nr:hypothetical protein [Planctomyces sp. SH-PL62]AMV38725.1 hypothetical protein VT85_14900 [Planctomyces sp. SH-PL62]